MTDLIKLLDGSIDDVKNGLGDVSHDDLLKLQTAEQAGKKRAGALDAISAALASMDARRTGGVVQMEPAIGVLAVAAALDTSELAGIAPATDFSTSGSPRQLTEFDPGHPAVDNDPRAGTTEHMNRIDFNDPTRSGHEVVADALAAQG